MRRFLSTIAFCVFLLIIGLLVLLPSASAEKNLLQNLLNLPAPPPPNPSFRATRRNVSSESVDRDKPPSDDAPIEELLAYWQNENNNFQEMGYNRTPSEQALQRIMAEVGEHPEKLAGLLNILPENAETQEFVKQLYDRQSSEKEESDSEWDGSVKSWLTYHSPHYSGELLKTAQTVGDTDEYVSSQKELLALARVDWDKARPILDRLLSDSSQPISQTLARWAFYQHALKEKDSSDIETYRRQLQATVENKSNKPGNRDLAMDALVESGDYEGRDDWYYTLLDDETLYDLRVNGTSYTGLTTLLARSPHDKYLTKMIELAGNANPTIRKAAVRNLTTLLDTKNPEVIKALLPWLENPDWAQEVNGERRQIIAALANITIPESVPGLIAVLNEKQPAEIYTSVDRIAPNANMMAMNTNRGGVASGTAQYDYVYRSEAVSALAMQKDMRAIAPLREILPQVEGWQLGNVVRALLASNGFSIPEQVEALETVAKGYNQPGENIAYPGNASAMVTNTSSYTMRGDTVAVDAVMSPPPPPPPYNYTAKRTFNPTDIKPILGQQLSIQTEADENLVAALIERINVLDTKEPQTAFGLRRIMMGWHGAAINALMMSDVKSGKTDTDAIVKLLSLRKELREKQSDAIFDMRNGNPTAFGIATCLLENPPDYDALLQSENIEAKTAMLACARLIRAALPIQKVAENLKSPNKTLALAAERYLETEDSPAAQSIVLAIHPNEAKILGAKNFFVPDDAPLTNSGYLPMLFASIGDATGVSNYYYDYSDDLGNGEKKLQKEVKENQELLGIYAYDENYIRIYKDKAIFSWQTDKARYHERELTKDEFDGFKNFLAAERVNELPPFFSDCEEQCGEKELLMLGRNGGRRVFLLGEESPKFFSELAASLERMRQPPAKLRYALEKDLAGLEILFEDENLKAETVWKNGADFRVLISDAQRREQIDKELEKQDTADEEKEDVDYDQLWKVRQKRRDQREFENFAWHKVADGKVTDLADQPANIEFIPKFDGAAVRAEKGQWKARTATFEIRADVEGLYKVAAGQMTKLAAGYYDKPVLSPNGRWVIVTKYDNEQGAKLVRFNLLTKKELPVKTEDYPQFAAVAPVSGINKVLIVGTGYGSEEREESEEELQSHGDFFMLDPETGAVGKVNSEIRPLAQQNFRPLQSNGKPDEFWAAIPEEEKETTSVGIYNAKTLNFKSILTIPQIQFNSMQMWIDADRIYFVYQGQLLDLPMPK